MRQVMGKVGNEKAQLWNVVVVVVGGKWGCRMRI